MTYGPVRKWRFPFQDQLDLRKNNFRALFFVLCVTGVLIVFISFSYFTSYPLGGRSLNGGKNETLKLQSLRKGLVNFKDFKISHSIKNIETLNSDDQISSQNKNILVSQVETSTDFRSSNSTIQNDTLGFWEDPRLDILHMPKLQFDSRFQNPCWYEPLTDSDPYENNIYSTYSPAAKQVLAKMTEKWEELFDSEVELTRLRCLPYFMIIGQPKCGSTDLFWKIAKHPDIGTPPIKELHWWSRNRQGRRFSFSKIIPFEDYVDMFDLPAVRIEERISNISLTNKNLLTKTLYTSQIITGEASVSLFWDNNDWKSFPENAGLEAPEYIVPHYIHHLLPDVKLVLILREPADRMYSDYLYFHSDSKSADDFHRAVVNAVGKYTNCTRKHGARQCIYDNGLANRVRVRLRLGMYSVYLNDWFSVFSREQFYVLRLDDYSREPMKYLKQIYQFLNMRSITPDEEEQLYDTKKTNTRKDSDKQLGGMHPETRRILEKFYRPYNLKLAKMLKDSRYLWNYK